MVAHFFAYILFDGPPPSNHPPFFPRLETSVVGGLSSWEHLVVAIVATAIGRGRWVAVAIAISTAIGRGRWVAIAIAIPPTIGAAICAGMGSHSHSRFRTRRRCCH